MRSTLFHTSNKRNPDAQRIQTDCSAQKYDGLEEPEGRLDDYLIAVKFQRGTNVTAMEYVQLMLDGLARHWLKNLQWGSISTWREFCNAFIKNFKSTYK